MTTHGSEVRLVAHLARANSQWYDLEAHPVLVVLSRPQPTAHPATTSRRAACPPGTTWPCTPTATLAIVTEPTQALAILDATIAQYAPSYQPQWDRLPPDYQARLLQGIVAFEVTITELQGQQKLSQNKTPTEQQRIREAVAGSSEQNAREVAAYMSRFASAAMP